MGLRNIVKRVASITLIATMAIGMVTSPVQAKGETDLQSNSTENFSVWLEDLAVDGKVEAKAYTYGGSVLTLDSQPDTFYEEKGTGVTVDETLHKSYWAGKRHADANNISTLPSGSGDGTLTMFTPAAKGTFTVYFNSSSFLRIHDFGSDGTKNGYTDTKTGISSYSFVAYPGHTYVLSTTGKTNNCFYAGYSFVVDEKVDNEVEIKNIDAVIGSSFAVEIVDAQLGGDVIKATTTTTSLKLLKGHTYSISTNDGGVKALVGEKTSFVANGEKVTITLNNVPDVTLSGKITGTPAGTVTKLVFTNMVNGTVATATISGDSYTCVMKPGEYKATVETTNGGVTYDRASVKVGADNTDEVYVEVPVTASEVEFKSVINVPGDYDSLNAASQAILSMKNRPEGEEGRVTINLKKDIFEQVVMAAPFVTLKGNGHEISWYYGVGTLYYSIDPATGLYSERLARDKYSSAEGDGNLWGGVFIVKGNNFIAEDTTFKNTYNYYLTEAEKTDIAGSNLNVNRLAENANVEEYAYKERSNAFYIAADNIEVYNCRILSSQDTLGRNGSANNNYHVYFNSCVIGGNADYICGEFTAVFDNCTLQWKTYANDTKNNAKVGYIVAPKTSPYVFRNCVITTDGKEGDAEVLGYYGRTWGDKSCATFINTETNGLINETGWTEMSTGQFASAVFKEYGNTSKGASFVTSASPAEYKTKEAVEAYVDTKTTTICDNVLGFKPVSYGKKVADKLPKTGDGFPVAAGAAAVTGTLLAAAAVVGKKKK